VAGQKKILIISTEMYHMTAQQLCINLKQSKTDPFGKGYRGAVGKMGVSFTILAWMVRRGRTDGPLFYFKDGSPLTQQFFCDCPVKGPLYHTGRS